MEIGPLLARAADRKGKTKADLSRATHIDAGTIGAIFKGDVANPEWLTVFKLVTAIETTWGDLFEETRLPLSEDDLAVAEESRDLLNRLIANTAAANELTGRKAQPKKRVPRKTKSFEDIRDPVELKGGVDEVEHLPHEEIPGRYVFSGAARAYLVLTDAMVRAKIAQRSIVYTQRPTQDIDSADGKVAIVDVNGTLLIKRVDRRGKEIWLISEHLRYKEIHLRYRRSIRSVAIVVNVA
ncbi:MAG TPA: S24 family peptidase [Thermoanaerobaculia bacterium]|nr:S24 family peptidase [Thermoanaerobaculia bacterium]